MKIEIIIAAASLSLLCGCGKKAASPEPTSVPVVEGKTIVRLAPADDNATFEAMDGAVLQDLCQKIVNRLESAAYTGYQLEFEGSRTLAVRNITDSEKLRTIVSAQGKMTVTDVDGKLCMTDEALTGAWYAGTPDPKVFVVSLDFTNEGAALFAQLTERISKEPEDRQYLSFALDGKEFAKPKINAPVKKASVDIESGSDSEKVTAIAVVLNSGELPVQLKIVEENK